MLVPGVRGTPIIESKWKLQAQTELGINLGAAMRHTAELQRGRATLAII